MSQNVMFEWGEADLAVGQLVETELPNAPSEVKKAIADYSMDNTQAASMFANNCKAVQTAKQIETIVGWPLSEHSHDRIKWVVERMKTV